ncbi:MAG TPA: DsbA family protein [Kofleriaceae bacterium]
MKVLCLALAGALVACHPQATAPKSSGDLETRVKRLEEQNAKYAEALAFLQKVYDQQKAQAAADDVDEPADDAIFAVDIAPDLAAGQVEGPADAPVTIVEAFDFACPYCRRAHDTLAELAKGGQVRIVYKNMVVHPQAMPAHLASCAAAKQGKYLAFASDMWTKGFDPYMASRDASKISEDSVIAIAKAAGIDVGKLKTDMHSDECANRIKADMDELDKFHVNATPTLFVNGTYVAGAPDETEFKALIAQKLATVKQSGVKPADYYEKEIMAKGEKQFRSKKDPKRS